MKLENDVKTELMNFSKRGIYLEGNIIKILIDSCEDDDDEFKSYLQLCLDRDIEIRKKRLVITKQIQSQNKELSILKNETDILNEQLKNSLNKIEKSKNDIQTELDFLQNKIQFELTEMIVKVALFIICGVGLITTMLYAYLIVFGIENKTVESSWSNMFSILLTNSFSIVGTIMGVKYANEKKIKSACNRCNLNQ